MQIVYISNRRDIMEETLRYVEHLMPFVTEVLVFCPREQRDEFQFRSSIPVRPIAEDELLRGVDTKRVNLSDHQIMNWNLRAGLGRHPAVAEEFIMSDDDYRPLVPIESTLFKDTGKYCCYFHYDLTKWPNYISHYDLGQHVTGRVLQAEGYSTLSFSSHMPQMLKKGIWQAAAERFADYGELPMDEWSVYFNFAVEEYPYLLASPAPYLTLCWTYPSPTRALSKPDGIYFENFYPSSYETGQVFEGLPTRFSLRRYQQHTEEKIKRCRRLQFRSDVKRLLLWISWRMSRITRRIARDVTFDLEGRRIKIAEFPRILVARRASWIPLHLELEVDGARGRSRLDGARLGYEWSRGEGRPEPPGRIRPGAGLPYGALEAFEVDFLVRSPAKKGLSSFDLRLRRGDSVYEPEGATRNWVLSL